MYFSTLLKPYILGLWNDTLREYETRFWNKPTFSVLFFSFIFYGLCSISHTFLMQLQKHELYTPELLQNILAATLLGLFFVTVFSAVISALGAMFASKDLHYLLCAPLRLRTIFHAKYLHVLFLSTWMFALLAISFAIGMYTAYEIPFQDTLLWALSFILFSSIPTSLGIIIVIIFANLVPAERLKEVIVLSVIIGLFFLLSYDYQAPIPTRDSNSIMRAVALSNRLQDAHLWWLPTTCLAEVITFSLLKRGIPLTSLGVLWVISLCLLALTYISFHFYFLRGWAKSTNSNIQRIVYKSDLLSKFGNLVFRKPSTFRAFIGKEFRSFMRDTTQSVQLLLLLTLTFIYLYNFRLMHAGTIVKDDMRGMWNVILSSANVLLGGSVIAAICTRFVFPSISLEGPSYIILRSTPITVHEFIRVKFLTWFVPVSILSLILFVSGALAISADIQTIMTLAFVAVNLAASLVALGIGTGAVYSKFNWDNPIQVISSFGSLIYMILAMGVIGINLIPSTSLFFLTHSVYVQEHIILVDRTMAHVCCAFLVSLINGAIIRRSLIAAESYLSSSEKISV